MNSINYQNLFGYAIKKKTHHEHPQICKNSMGKIKIYLNDAKPKILSKILLTENSSLGRQAMEIWLYIPS